MQILCKTTPIQLARHYAMDIRDILMATPCHGAIKSPPQSLCHCIMVIMDILMATPCHGAIKSPPHTVIRSPPQLPCQPILLKTTSI